MAAHYDAAGGGLDRFQPIVTPERYPGEHYDSTLGIQLSAGDKEGFSDRFWDREIDSRDTSGNKTLERSTQDYADFCRWK
jgi:hypothetical protein